MQCQTTSSTVAEAKAVASSVLSSVWWMAWRRAPRVSFVRNVSWLVCGVGVRCYLSFLSSTCANLAFMCASTCAFILSALDDEEEADWTMGEGIEGSGGGGREGREGGRRATKREGETVDSSMNRVSAELNSQRQAASQGESIECSCGCLCYQSWQCAE